MKTITATDAKNRFGEVLDLLKGDSLLIERNGKPAAIVFAAEVGKKMVLSSYAHGTISRSAAMGMLGYDWYGQLLDAIAAARIERPSVSTNERKKMKTVLEKSIRPRK